jgi:hypothetical protein
LLPGFGPVQEQEYAQWLARRTNSLVSKWCSMMLVWFLCSWLRSAELGVTTMVSYIPVNLIMVAPYALSVYLARRHNYR